MAAGVAMAAKTMLFRNVGNVLVAVHTAAPPDDQEWEAYVQFGKKLPPTCRRTLVISKGGGPNAKQRKYANDEFLNHVTLTVAVVNDSTMVRGIVTAMGWFNSLIKPFPNTDQGIQDALKYLNVQGKDVGLVVTEVQKMKAELGIK